MDWAFMGSSRKSTPLCAQEIALGRAIRWPPPTTLATAYAFDMPAPDTLTRRRERIAGIHGLSVDTVELYERNIIDELAVRLVHGELPVGS